MMSRNERDGALADVVVAYDAADKLAALQLAAQLMADSVGVSVDDALDGLASARAQERLGAALVLVVVLSQRVAPEHVAPWTQAWLRESLRRRDRPVLVVRLDAAAAVPAALQLAEVVDWQPAAPRTASASVVRRVRHLLRRTEAKPWQPAVWALPPRPPLDGAARSSPGAPGALSTLAEALWPAPFNGVATGVAVTGAPGGAAVDAASLTLLAAHHYRMRFTRAWLLDGSSAASLEDGLCAVAQALGIDVPPLPAPAARDGDGGTEQTQRAGVAAAVQSRLCQGDCVGWLLVVHNVDGPEMQLRLRAAVPRTGGCVLVASRLCGWSSDWSVVRLDGVGDGRGSAGGADDAVPAVQRALEREPSLSSLLMALQLLHPLSVSLTVLEAVDAKLRAGTAAQAADVGLSRRLSVLAAHSVVVAVSGTSVAMQRSAQAAMRTVAPCEPAVADKVVEVMVALAREYGRRDFALMRELLAHTAEALSFYQHTARSPTTGADHAWLLMCRATIFAVSFGQADAARPLADRALAMFKQECGPDRVEVAAALATLGAVQRRLGDARMARSLLERALAIYERHLGGDAADVAQVLVDLGDVLCALGDSCGADAALQRALRIYDGAGEHEDRLRVADALTSLGRLRATLGDADRAQRVLERALAVYEGQQQLGADHPAVAATLAVLGGVLTGRGDAGRGQAILERALGAQERHFGADHAEVAVTLVRLADACELLGEGARAAELVERALDIQERHYGSDHASVALTVAQLAHVRGHLGDAASRRTLWERVRALPAAVCDVLIGSAGDAAEEWDAVTALASQLIGRGHRVVLDRALTTSLAGSAAAALEVAAQTARTLVVVVSPAWLDARRQQRSLRAATMFLERLRDAGDAAVDRRDVVVFFAGGASLEPPAAVSPDTRAVLAHLIARRAERVGGRLSVEAVQRIADALGKVIPTPRRRTCASPCDAMAPATFTHVTHCACVEGGGWMGAGPAGGAGLQTGRPRTNALSHSKATPCQRRTPALPPGCSWRGARSSPFKGAPDCWTSWGRGV